MPTSDRKKAVAAMVAVSAYLDQEREAAANATVVMPMAIYQQLMALVEQLHHYYGPSGGVPSN